MADRTLAPWKIQWRRMMIDHLPPELIQEILSRLPLNSLFQTRCVSHSFHTLINEKRFKAMQYTHSIRSPNPNSLIICCSSRSDSDLYYISDFLSSSKVTKLTKLPFKAWVRKFIIVGSCNGLLCLAHRFGVAVICNPVSGSWLEISETKTDEFDESYYLGLGYNPKCNEYKVIRKRFSLCLQKLTTEIVTICKQTLTTGFVTKGVNCIVTVGGDCWRSIGTDETVDTNGSVESVVKTDFGDYPGVYCKGYLHWLIGDDGYDRNFIKRFDVDKEKFGMVSLPESIKTMDDSHFRSVYLGMLGGLPMVADCSQRGIVDVWTMNNYGVNESWIHDFIIRGPGVCKELKPLAVQKNGGAVLEVDGNTLFSYDPETGECTRIKMPRRKGFVATPHVGTLISLEDIFGYEIQERAVFASSSC